MCEVCYEEIEALVQEQGGLLETFRTEMIEARAKLYSEGIAEQSARLDKCIDFIDCNKVQMSRRG